MIEFHQVLIRENLCSSVAKN